MKIQLESTTRIVKLNGVPARIWEGATEDGIDVIAFVTRIAVARENDCSDFDRELEEHRPPSPDAMSFPSQMTL